MYNNAIDFAMNRLLYLIPKEVIYEAFGPKARAQKRSIDGIIKEEIIAKIVLPSCNLYSGRIKKVKLINSYAIRTEELGGVFPISVSNFSYFRIPPEETENRKIIYVLDIGYPMEVFGGPGVFSHGYGNTVSGMASAALASFTEVPQSQTPTPILMDNNIVRLDPPQAFFVEWILSCMLEYDVNFTNVYPNLFMPIAELVRYATETYIYNELYIKIGQAETSGGQNIGVFRSIIEKFESSNEKFEEALIRFRGESAFDKEQLNDLLSLIFP